MAIIDLLSNSLRDVLTILQQYFDIKRKKKITKSNNIHGSNPPFEIWRVETYYLFSIKESELLKHLENQNT